MPRVAPERTGRIDPENIFLAFRVVWAGTVLLVTIGIGAAVGRGLLQFMFWLGRG